MYEHIDNCSFGLYCKDDGAGELIKTEIERTAEYISKNVIPNHNFTVAQQVKPDIFLTYCINNGQVSFGVYNCEKISLDDKAYGEAFVSKKFAKAMGLLRKSAVASSKLLENGEKIFQMTDLTKKWGEILRKREKAIVKDIKLPTLH